MNEQNNSTPEHYNKQCPRCSLKLDPYRLSEIYGHSGIQHHLSKKALCTGNRGHKSLIEDLEDIIRTARRWISMVEEDQFDPTPGSAFDPVRPIHAPSSGFAVGRRVRVKSGFSSMDPILVGCCGAIHSINEEDLVIQLDVDKAGSVRFFQEGDLELLPEEPAAPQFAPGKRVVVDTKDHDKHLSRWHGDVGVITEDFHGAGWVVRITTTHGEIHHPWFKEDNLRLLPEDQQPQAGGSAL